MLTFKDFMNKEKKAKNANDRQIASPSGTSIANVTSQQISLARVGISVSDAKTTGKEVAKIALSDDFISELSSTIGQPRTNETEDEFVNRAKAAFKSILKQKISK